MAAEREQAFDGLAVGREREGKQEWGETAI